MPALLEPIVSGLRRNLHFFLGFALLFMLIGCEKPAPTAGVRGRDAVMKETGTDIDMFYSDSARVRARIRGPVLDRFVERSNLREEFPKGVQITFFDNEGEEQSALRAQKGLRLGSKQRTVLTDSVVWVSVKNERLETSELIWDEREQAIFSDKFVKITRPGEVIYGYGFRTNSTFTEWRILAVEGVFKTQNEL
jgi:LPS export ABC transporter protein LptC